MITTDFKHGAEFMYTIKKILVGNKINHAIKITSLKRGGFNAYEGYQFEFNVKISIVDSKKVFKDTKAKSKTIKILTNSTYIEDFENDDLVGSLQEYFEMLYIWLRQTKKKLSETTNFKTIKLKIRGK